MDDVRDQLVKAYEDGHLGSSFTKTAPQDYVDGWKGNEDKYLRYLVEQDVVEDGEYDQYSLVEDPDKR